VIELADTSAWIIARRERSGRGAVFADAVNAGRVAICDAIKLELLRGARNPAELRSARATFDGLPDCPMTRLVWRRAMWVQEQLSRARGGRHHAVPPTNLIVAAAAEARGMAVLHHDPHFDEIAAVTGQPMRWI
jgi:predicted nucleic acid-binding protein